MRTTIKIGDKFGRLTIESRDLKKTNRVRWVCLCVCGNKTSVETGSLTSGNTRSCGCIRSEAMREKLTTHGSCYTAEYIVWSGMRQRCTNPKHIVFKHYGGRGIKVCDRWNKDFTNFIEDMGKRPSAKHSVERRDNNGDYTPENCYWATRKEQQSNYCNNRLITFNGITKPLFLWALDIGVDKTSMAERIEKWGIEKALSTPKRTVKTYTFKNATKTASEWAKHLKLPYTTITSRLRKHPIEIALDRSKIRNRMSSNIGN